jgi:hypothetical protein
MTKRPNLQEVRRVRHEISAEIGHDPARIREYFAALQASIKSRTINVADQGVGGRTKHCIDVADQPIPDGGSTPTSR